MCGKIFKPYKKNHLFCSKKCYRKWYWIKIEKPLQHNFPSFICEFCNNKIQLDFFPIKDKKKWSEFICPICKHKIKTEQDEQIEIKIEKDL